MHFCFTENRSERMDFYRIPILDTSGKINKKELPPVRGFSEEDIDVENFSNQTAKTIATIWCKILKICSLDANESFFDLGGLVENEKNFFFHLILIFTYFRHSLLAALAVGQINDTLQTNLSTLDLYTNSTIELLLEKMTTGENNQNSELNLLQDLDSLSIKHM